MEDPIVAAESAPVPAPETSPAPDPFAVDEGVLASLAPEARTAVEPMLESWKKQALESIEKTRSTYKPMEEKAKALETLVKDPRFVSWYNEQVNGKPQKETPTTPEARKPIVTPQEWNEALQLAANGDPSRYEDLNRRIAEAATEPALTALGQKQKELSMSIEMDNIFRKYPDAKDLDNIRVGDGPDAPSLFEMALYYIHDLKKQPMESAYKAAKAMHETIMASAKKTALNLVDEKKKSVTESAPTSTKEENVVYANSPEQVLREQIKAQISGRNVQVVLKR